MDQDFDILPIEVSDKVKNTYGPYLQLRSNGNSYLNEKAAKVLGVVHESTIRFHFSRDMSSFYISSESSDGHIVRKASGLYKFSATKQVREIFKALNIEGTRANFPMANSLEERRDPKGNLIYVVFVSPKPYNIE